MQLRIPVCGRVHVHVVYIIRFEDNKAVVESNIRRATDYLNSHQNAA